MKNKHDVDYVENLAFDMIESGVLKEHIERCGSIPKPLTFKRQKFFLRLTEETVTVIANGGAKVTFDRQIVNGGVESLGKLNMEKPEEKKPADVSQSGEAVVPNNEPKVSYDIPGETLGDQFAAFQKQYRAKQEKRSKVVKCVLGGLAVVGLVAGTVAAIRNS